MILFDIINLQSSMDRLKGLQAEYKRMQIKALQSSMDRLKAHCGHIPQAIHTFTIQYG